MPAVNPDRALIYWPQSEGLPAGLRTLLEQDGFAVQEVDSLAAVTAAARAGDCQLLVAAPPKGMRDLTALIRMGKREGMAIVFVTQSPPARDLPRLRPWPCAWVSNADAFSRALAIAFATRDALAQRSAPEMVAALCELGGLAQSSHPPQEVVGRILEKCAEGISAAWVGLKVRPGAEFQLRLPLGAGIRGPTGSLDTQAGQTQQQSRALYEQVRLKEREQERYTAPVFGGQEVLATLAVERRGAQRLGRAGQSLVIAAADLIAVQFERARVADLLEHRERLAMFGELMASVSHEMNSPVSYVHSNLAFVQTLLRDSDELSESTRAEVGTILQECQDGVAQLSSLVGSLKSGARQPKDGTGQVDLSWLAQRAAELMKNHGRARELQMQLAPEVPARGDFGRLLQVTMNLLINALHAIGSRGRVTLRTGVEGERVFLEVEDDGPGVPPEVVERIFEPFFTTKPSASGTGLGLSISRRIAREHGGELSYRSGTSIGACFRLSLPLEEGLHYRLEEA
ncbi:MAG: ATP-binding protein [Myxococcota bacterium]|nr:ATP-binding protein [Myxococcota bacterium]